MADTKISDLTAADALTGSEIVPVVQDGANVRTTAAAIAARAFADLLELPEYDPETDEEFSFVFCVGAAGEILRFTVEGDYVVDWGDGSEAEEIDSGVEAEHGYTFESLPKNTLTLDLERQAVVTVTPQEGASITSISFVLIN